MSCIFIPGSNYCYCFKSLSDRPTTILLRQKDVLITRDAAIREAELTRYLMLAHNSYQTLFDIRHKMNWSHYYTFRTTLGATFSSLKGCSVSCGIHQKHQVKYHICYMLRLCNGTTAHIQRRRCFQRNGGRRLNVRGKKERERNQDVPLTWKKE